MTTDFRALCAELIDIITAHANPDDYAVGYVADVLTRARAALADEPAVPEGRGPVAVTGQPSDEDLWNTADLVFQANSWPPDAIRYARAVLARWGNSAPQPVPVSERLPGDQLCWWFEADEDCGYGSNWTLLRIRGSATGYTHWLPAHALPLPEVSK